MVKQSTFLSQYTTCNHYSKKMGLLGNSHFVELKLKLYTFPGGLCLHSNKLTERPTHSSHYKPVFQLPCHQTTEHLLSSGCKTPQLILNIPLTDHLACHIDAPVLSRDYFTASQAVRTPCCAFQLFSMYLRLMRLELERQIYS